MDALIDWLDRLGRNGILSLIGFLGTVTGTVLGFAAFLGVTPSEVAKLFTWDRQLGQLLVFAGSVALMFSYWRSYSENRALKTSYAQVHSVLHQQRDWLFRHLCQKEYVPKEAWLSDEAAVLSRMCQNLSCVFRGLIRRKCTVCVTLLSSGSGTSNPFCYVYAESDFDIKRHEARRRKFNLDERNTRFQEAMRLRQDTGEMYFWAADLGALDSERYKDELPNWKAHYRSCIVVPIRRADEYGQTEDLLGFLKVETMAPNRLNEGEHLQLLASIADSIYACVTVGRLKNQSVAPQPQPSERVKSA